MQIKLSYKLFAAFFLILAVVVGAMILSRYLFSLNFKNYIRQVELEKLQSLVPALQEEYRTSGGWEGLAADPGRWQRMLSFAPERMEPAPHPPPGEPHPPGFEPPRHRPPGGPSPVVLLDARQRPVIGPPGPRDRRQLIAIEVDSQVVGWLGLHPHQPFESGPPAVLLARQARQLSVLGGAVIGLTALIAFLFSRHLLKPIQRLARGTRELADRNFAVRIKACTSDELGQLAENFNAMAQTLDQFEKMRAQWLTDISHELRTPLTILRGEIEALLDGVRDPTPRNLESLHAEILGVSRLVEDLHQLSMADTDKLHLKRQWLELRGVLERVADSYRNRLDQCRIELEMMLEEIDGVRFKGDADRLGQVFTNILENVCKYVQAPGSLEISGRVDGRFLTLCFQDSGPGVPGEALPRLFDRLYRVDGSRSRASGGSGLGLSICRQIIDNHQGTIWAENSPLGGLSIRIRLPIEEEKN